MLASLGHHQALRGVGVAGVERVQALMCVRTQDGSTGLGGIAVGV